METFSYSTRRNLSVKWSFLPKKTTIKFVDKILISKFYRQSGKDPSVIVNDLISIDNYW